ncbi:wall-associated receptor kinase 5-like [Triticum dicoccoides]|uniref:wall-associated receptor kinase 5-like n=1 Tax=Triticum dicoccoides TaxID=85692 RepID=UPI001891C0F2|nr:wall-associated receptor kinase 5-like [Triticum dicoccoides]
MAQITISAVAIAATALILVPVFTFTRGSVAAAGDPSPAPIGMPKCVRSCGGVEVPYPFGIGSDASCYLPGFNLTCDNTTGSGPRLLLDTEGTLQILWNPGVGLVMQAQRNGDVKIDGNGNGMFSRGLRRDGPYSLSTVKTVHSELILTGCNMQATVKSGNVIVASCTSVCGDKADRDPYAADDESSVGLPCSGGTGCCRAGIVTMDGYDKDGEVYNSSSTGTSKYTVQLRWFGWNRSADLERFPVRVFVADHRWFDDSSIYNDLLQTGQPPSEETMKVPLWLSWEVVGHPSSVCKSNHSEPIKGKRRGGYTCLCSQGYDGNPYLTNGCEDINECEWSRPETKCYGDCKNTDGSFTCRCPPGTTGNHTVPGGCVCVQSMFTVASHNTFSGLSIIIGVASGAGIILLVVTSYFISYKLKHQRAQMLKQKYFEQNRGKLLQQLLYQRADIAEKMIISLDELEKATNNFDEARELGGGGHGTVYKGILSDLHVVAIKKPKMVVQREIDEFINEVAILSQINHRNVVKLYGCCLETKVPLLVYEFISNGTLYDHLHVEGPRSLSWDDRLRIATETAKSLAHLHSTAIVPIIHRDVKPANILLDDTLTAKVADFGASRYIPLEKSGLTTMVQGTLGYLDPVYMHTWRLTEKSDVYSFGVMLIELMTRKKPFTYMAPEGNGLVAHFVTLYTEGNFSQILDPQVMSEGGNKIHEIAGIAVECVKIRREERPTMRQVELRLEAAQSTDRSEANGDIAANSLSAGTARLTSRQYSLEQEFILFARYPR